MKNGSHNSNACVACIYDRENKEWLVFQHLDYKREIFEASDIPAALNDAETLAKTRSLHIVCLLAYEAAQAFDKHLKTKAPTAGFPLAAFLGASKVEKTKNLQQYISGNEPANFAVWTPEMDTAEYSKGIGRIRDYIRLGHTYQVNFTQRLRADITTPPSTLFLSMIRAQRHHYGAFILLDDWAVLSASPELFFRKNGAHVTTKPMKGTAPRKPVAELDCQQRDWLRSSQKNLAENVMIVDMMRNDLGRVAIPGSVNVSNLFEIEKYPTVWQMTSTVECETQATLVELMSALFPCASITGAPKRRTMEIIQELETSPRQIYTGCIGFIRPGGDSQFNVAIRTALINRHSSQAEFGVGGGIVWDSTAENEARECVDKASFLSHSEPEFNLFETILWTREHGFFLLDLHLQRITASAEYFDFNFDRDELRRQITSRPETKDSNGAYQNANALRVRVTLASSGETTFDEIEFDQSQAGGIVKLGLAQTPVEPDNRFLYHKTTNRTIYEQARKAAGNEVDDVLLWNAQGNVTESAIANLVFAKNGELFTPPIADGLLPGTYRKMMLESGRVKEKSLPLDELQTCDSLILINSLRGERPARIIATLGM